MIEKTRVVSVRFTLREYAELSRRAESLGVSLSRVLVDAWRNQTNPAGQQLDHLATRLDHLDHKLAACIQFLFRVQVPPSDREYRQLSQELNQVLRGVG